MTETNSTETNSTETGSATQEASAMAEVVITVDHVYLPFDEAGKNVRTDWAVTSVSTTRVSKRERLQVPTDLAKHLSKRDQAEIL